MNANRNSQTQFQPLFPRLLQFGIAYGDLVNACTRATDWPSWAEALWQQAEAFESAAMVADRDGHTVSAQEARRKAVDYYHYAQLRLSESVAKQQLRDASRRNYSEYASAIQPPAIRIEVPFASGVLPGYQRIFSCQAPCVVLIGGLDSAKEVELHYLAEVFLKRGNSVFYFDGPGQGELDDQPLVCAEFDAAVTAVTDHLRLETVGLFGVSFGGHLGCRAAAANKRIHACICLGGFFDGRVFIGASDLVKATVRRRFGLEPADDLSRLEQVVTLEPFRGRMKSPLLIVHGSEDHLVDLSQVTAVREWSGGPTELWIVEGAEHVCTNRFSEYLPVIGDWMTDRLANATTAERESHAEVR